MARATRSPDRTQSPSFATPDLVYHGGMNPGVRIFDTRRAEGFATWFQSTERGAAAFALSRAAREGIAATVYTARIRIERPYITTETALKERAALQHRGALGALRDQLEREGYDGAILVDRRNAPEAWGSFEPTKIEIQGEEAAIDVARRYPDLASRADSYREARRGASGRSES